MSDELPPLRCDDESTWRHKGEKIDLPRVLQLIEENGGPEGLDLHGADLRDLDARLEALRAYIEAYAQKHGVDAKPPWLGLNAAINLHAAHLENAFLWRAHLEDADLGGAHLNNAFLVDAHLENANLVDAHLGNASLHGAHLENAKLWGAHLNNAFLLGAHLENAKLWGAHLKNARLGGAHLDNAFLVDAHLENANLVGAYLQNALLLRAHLENAVLDETRLSGAVWYGCFLDRTRLHRELLGQAIGDELRAKARAILPSSFHHARESYLSFKTNFDSIGRYEDASWAYVKEQQMEKAMYFPTTAGHEWIRERMGDAVPPAWWGPHRLPRWLWWKLRSGFYHTCLFAGLCPRHVTQGREAPTEHIIEPHERLSRSRWARNWAYELLAGYGERPILPLLWAAVLSILAFPLLYWVTGALPGHGRVLTSTAPSDIDWAGWGDSIIFSMTSFATLAFNRLQPDSALANILAASEAAIGVLAFALFVFTLGNRMRRS